MTNEQYDKIRELITKAKIKSLTKKEKIELAKLLELSEKDESTSN